MEKTEQKAIKRHALQCAYETDPGLKIFIFVNSLTYYKGPDLSLNHPAIASERSWC